MSSKKNITIDQTALLNTSDNKHSIKRQKKTKLPSLNSTTVKQNLLQRIKVINGHNYTRQMNIKFGVDTLLK